MKAELIKLGLTNNEATIYLALLDSGLTTAGTLINKTKLHSNIVYFNLEKLKEKGLVSHILIKKVMHFEVTESTELYEFIKSKKREILKKEELVKKLLPEIEKRRNITKKNYKAVIYSGIPGLKTAMNSIAKKEKDYVLFSSGKGLDLATGKHFRKQWHKKLDESKVKGKVLISENMRGYLKINSSKELTEIKHLPKGHEQNATILVCDNLILNFIWSQEPIVVLIQSIETAETYKYYFDYLWEIAKY